jgi:hypothetical protein
MCFRAVGTVAKFRALRAARPTEANGLHPPREPGAEHLGDERRGPAQPLEPRGRFCLLSTCLLTRTGILSTT